jgi:hypothetical protein
LLRLPQLRPDELPAQAEIEATVAALSEPANPSWILARIASLLLPYYEKDTPQAVREMEAEDWLEEMDGLPRWAIDRAVRWWKGPDNPDRRKRPLEGDISKLAKRYAGNVKAVPLLADRMRGQLKPAPIPQQSEITEEERQRRAEFAESLLRGSGFKRMETEQ